MLRRRLLASVAIVSGLGLVAEIWHARGADAQNDAVYAKLSLSFENNLPTWFSSGLLLLCAIAAGVIASARVGYRRHWWVIAGIAGWMSLDEAAELHEHLGGHFATTGIFYFDWVIPAAAVVGVLGAAFVPFVRALAPATRRRLVTAAIIYVLGALIMELPLGWWTERYGTEGFGYGLIDWVEETMEMIGASLAFVALVAHRQETA